MKTFFEKIRKNRTYLAIFIISILTTLWLILSLALYIISPSMIFRQSVSIVNQPDYGHEVIFVRNKADQNVSIWYFENPQSERVILYLHGNTGRISGFYEEFYNYGTIVSPAYPGYHESEGSPTPKNVYETATLTYDWLVNEKKIKPENIVILGHSLGGSPATYLASQRPEAKKLILVNTFSSVQSMCFRDYTILCTFSGGLFNTAKSAEKVKTPVRQFYYTKDKTVPPEEGKKLFEFFKNDDKELFELTRDTHTYFDIPYVFEKAGEKLEIRQPQIPQPQIQIPEGPEAPNPNSQTPAQ